MKISASHIHQYSFITEREKGDGYRTKGAILQNRKKQRESCPQVNLIKRPFNPSTTSRVQQSSQLED